MAITKESNTPSGTTKQLICQCCGMPLDPDTISREPDGILNEEYCKWCYTDGKFVYKNMDDLIDYCVKSFSNEQFPAEKMEEHMRNTLPELNYWKNVNGEKI